MNLKNAAKFFHLESCESTQDQALTLSLESAAPVIVLSDLQSHGRGRRGREWVSAPGQSFMLSISFPKADVAESHLLSLCAGACLYSTLTQASPKFSALTLKWPNDLGRYEGNSFRKSAGILIELKKDWYLAGFGINLQGEAPWAGALSLSEVDKNYKMPRAEFALKLARKLYAELALLKSSSSDLLEFLNNHAMQGLWHKSLGNKWQDCVATGLAGDGALVVRTPTGQIQTIYSGDI